MKAFITLLALVLPLLSNAQSVWRTSATEPTFGRTANCASGRGLCGMTVNQSDTVKSNVANYSKTMSEHSFILTISRKSLVVADEIRIAGKPFIEIGADEKLEFVQQEVLLVSKLSLQNLNLDPQTNKIYPGNYPMFLSKDKIEILFTLRN